MPRSGPWITPTMRSLASHPVVPHFDAGISIHSELTPPAASQQPLTQLSE
jgi:hypothetical protein